MSLSFVLSATLWLAPPIAATPTNPQAAPAFSLSQVQPYFPTGKAKEAVALLRLDRAADAVPLLTEALAAEKTATQPLRFLLANALLRAGRFAEAAKQFDELRGKYALLADYVALGAAKAYNGLGKLEDARARLALLAPTSPLAADATLVEADLFTKQQKPLDAATLLSTYLTKYPDSWRTHEVRAKLARVLEAAGKKEAAINEWRTLYIEAAHEPFGQEAAQHLPDRALPAAERQRRAMVLFDGMRNKESEDEWKLVLSRTDVGDDDRCVAHYHMAQSVFKQRDRGRAAPLFDEARTVCEKAKNEDLLVKSIYQAGRSYGSRKEPALMQKGVERFAEIVQHHKDHSYADDAQVRQAELAETLGQKDESQKLLADVATLFPGGDQRGEALWRLAFAALRGKDYPTAEKWLTQALTEMPRQDGWWEAGRTLYWLGRSAELRGEKVKALDYYERAAREYPLAYYALFALNRLRSLDEPRFGKLAGPWAEAAAAAPAEWKFGAQPLFAQEGWTRAVELLRLGLGPEAKRELYQLGMQPPKKGTPIAPAEEERLWLATALLDAAGQWASSHAIPRHSITGYARSWPASDGLTKWRLSYPRGYADLVEPATRENGFPAELEFAIMREESAFDPTMESFANAVGLTQLTAAPATRFANGLPHDRAALKIPAINVPIGARELGHLVKLYASNFPLAIAGYNAGENAVNRWLKDPDRNDGNLDLFLEAIPYDETRGYTKRVLSSYFAYAWLAGGKLEDRVPKLVPTLKR